MLKESEINFLKDYIKECNSPTMAGFAQKLLDTHESMELYPIYIPSYNVTTKRKLIYNLVKESIPFTVYSYTDQHERYESIGCKDIVDVDTSIRKNCLNPLAVKLNMIMDDARAKGQKRIFRLDDDLVSIGLPYTVERPYGIVNDIKTATMNLGLHFWQIITEALDIDLSVLNTRIHVRWNAKYINEGRRICVPHFLAGFVAMNLERVPNYDANMGWEDIDLFVRCIKMGLNCGKIPLVQTSPQKGVYDYRSVEKTVNYSLQVFEKYGPDCIVLKTLNDGMLWCNVNTKWAKSQDRLTAECPLTPEQRARLFDIISVKHKETICLEKLN